MRVVDVHQHLMPEPLIRALERRAESPRLRGRTLELSTERPCELDLDAHLPERRLERLARDGIDVALVSPAPTCEIDRHPDLRDAYHDGAAALAEDSQGRLRPLAAGEVVPGFAGACIAALDLVAGSNALLDDLAGAGGFLFVHPGPPAAPAPPAAPGWWPAVVDYTAQMQAAYAAWLARDSERHASVPVVFAILAGGAPVQLERLRSRGFHQADALRPNVFFETSSYGRRALELAFSTYGVTQIVFGSDVPVIDAGPTLEAVRGFGDAVSELVLSTNPAPLLPD